MGKQNAHRGTYKTIIKELLAERDGLACGICREAGTTIKDFTLDHIKPLAIGGAHSFSNLQLAHGWCNLKKGHQYEQEQPSRESE